MHNCFRGGYTQHCELPAAEVIELWTVGLYIPHNNQSGCAILMTSRILPSVWEVEAYFPRRLSLLGNFCLFLTE